MRSIEQLMALTDRLAIKMGQEPQDTESVGAITRILARERHLRRLEKGLVVPRDQPGALHGQGI